MWMELKLASLCAVHPPSAQTPVTLLHVLTAGQEHWGLAHHFHLNMFLASNVQKAKLCLLAVFAALQNPWLYPWCKSTSRKFAANTNSGEKSSVRQQRQKTRTGLHLFPNQGRQKLCLTFLAQAKLQITHVGGCTLSPSLCVFAMSRKFSLSSAAASNPCTGGKQEATGGAAGQQQVPSVREGSSTGSPSTHQPCPSCCSPQLSPAMISGSY
ncbi:uncharacterized protein LOC127472216 [Manacus candei]|uniref:uncharacterized protein LOC127472216 n=1 Tax=Manacus candei TaxID=415023 RepID=UPI002227EBBF|nr:uncharacterized protein LOC127472216 [Manacus candei]